MTKRIAQIPVAHVGEIPANAWLEFEDPADTSEAPEGTSRRMPASGLPGRSANSLPVARLASSGGDVLFGRATAGAGAGEEIPCTAIARQLLAAADAAAIRTALNLVVGVNVQAYDAELQAIAGLVSAADRVPYFTGSGTAALATLTAHGRGLISAPDAATVRASLDLEVGIDVQAFDADLAAIAGLVSAADRVPYFTGSGTAALATLTAFARGLLDDADAAAARATLGLVIGTDVQAFDSELTAIAALTSAADRLPYFIAPGAAALATFTAAARNLLDDATVDEMLATLGGATPTGSGALVRKTSPALVTPDLGTPSAGSLGNCSGLPIAGVVMGNWMVVHSNGAGAPQQLALGSVGRFLRSTGAAAAPEFARGWTLLMKAADTNRNTTTTLADDPDLLIPLSAGKKYLLRLTVYYGIANGTMDFKYATAFSGTANGSPLTIRRHMAAGGAAGTDNENSQPLTGQVGSTQVASTAGGVGRIEIEQLIDVNTAGTWSFQWAQDVSDAADATVKFGSYIAWTEIL